MSSPLARPVSQFATLLLLLSLLVACGHDQVRRVPDTRDERSRLSLAEQAAIVAGRQVGVPYRYGGRTVSGFDCSGLTQFAYASVGKRIPRTTAGQWRELAPVPGAGLQIGDVLFFRIDGRISHVGLYLGSGRFVHAPSSGREVTIARLNSDYYRKAFVRGGRPQ
jgi:cell wall-associated NlpC family hydrolase